MNFDVINHNHILSELYNVAKAGRASLDIAHSLCCYNLSFEVHFSYKTRTSRMTCSSLLSINQPMIENKRNVQQTGGGVR